MRPKNEISLLLILMYPGPNYLSTETVTNRGQFFLSGLLSISAATTTQAALVAQHYSAGISGSMSCALCFFYAGEAGVSMFVFLNLLFLVGPSAEKNETKTKKGRRPPSSPITSLTTRCVCSVQMGDPHITPLFLNAFLSSVPRFMVFFYAAERGHF